MAHPVKVEHVSDESTPRADGAAPKRKAKVARKHTVGRVILLSTLVLALVTGLSIVYLVARYNGNIEAISLDELGDDRPEEVYKGNGKPLDILVMGSDSRECEGCDIDQEGGAGSDTTILVHLSADRSRAYAVSIPRDSIVDRPETGCDSGGTDVMWNEAYERGGPVCTLAQVEATTGIRVEHFVVVDFNSFGDMVDAVDGVPVCVPEDIVDRERGIFVPKGNPTVLTGDQALDYVRARYVGELIQQNDISRIRRQQEFIGALVREVKSAGTLTRIDRVVKFLEAATKSLTTDEEFASVTRLGRVAMQLQGIGLDEVKFVTLPTAYYPMDSEFRGKVYWEPEAEQIWKLIARDEALPASLIGENAVSAAGPPGTETPSTEEPGAEEGPSTPASPSQSPLETNSPSQSPSQSPTRSATTPSAPTTAPEDRIFGVCA